MESFEESNAEGLDKEACAAENNTPIELISKAVDFLFVHY